MFEKIRISKDSTKKLISVLLVASILFLSLSILTESHDNRKLISDNDGATESALCSILSEIKGVGDVNVLVEYGQESAVSGVIITAEGAGNPVVKNEITNGISKNTKYDST